MAQKEVQIQIPDGYDDYKIEQTENGCVVKFIKKELSLDDILSKYEWDGDLECISIRYYFPQKNITDVCSKVSALGKLCCVADYLNRGYKVTPYNGYCIHLNYNSNEYQVMSLCGNLNGMPIFFSKDLAEKAIKLMGTQLLDKIFK